MKKSLLPLFFSILYSSAAAQSVEIIPGKSIHSGVISDVTLRSTGTPEIKGQRSSGSIDSPTAVTDNSILLELNGTGYNSTVFANSARIRFSSSEGWNNLVRGSRLQFFTTQNGTTALAEKMRIDHNGNVGIGTISPLSKLDVSGDLILSKSGGGFGSRSLLFYSDQGTANEWRPGYISSGDNTGFTGRLDFYTNGTGSANKSGSVLGMSVVNGRVGVGSSVAVFNPQYPLQIVSTNTSNSSTDGIFSIGVNSGNHMNFSRTDIDTWSNTLGSALFLNYSSKAKVQIGSAEEGNLDVNGYTNLGAQAPKIKMKKLTGTIPVELTFPSFYINHGIAERSKILSVSIFVTIGDLIEIPPINSSPSIHYNYDVRNNSIFLYEIGESMAGLPYRVLITYEE